MRRHYVFAMILNVTLGLALHSCECTEPSEGDSCPEPIYSGAGYSFPSYGMVPLGVCPSARIVLFNVWPSTATVVHDLTTQQTLSLDSLIVKGWNDTTELRRINHIVMSPNDEPRVLLSATVIERDGRECSAFYLYDLKQQKLTKQKVPVSFGSVNLYRTSDATARSWALSENGSESFYRIGTTWFDLNANLLRDDLEDPRIMSEAFVDIGRHIIMRRRDDVNRYSYELTSKGTVYKVFDDVKAVSNVTSISPDRKTIVFELGFVTDYRDPNYGRRILVVTRDGENYRVAQLSSPWTRSCLYARNGANPVFIDNDRLLMSVHGDVEQATRLGVYRISTGVMQVVDLAALHNLL